MKKETCENCKYGVIWSSGTVSPYLNNMIQCQRYNTPQPTRRDYFCGEFKKKTKKELKQ